MNVFGMVKEPTAKCSQCGKTWKIYGKPKYTDMLGFYAPDVKCLPKHKCKGDK